MDIRTFFNVEYAKLQTSHKNVSKELEKTSEIIDNQISEFEAVNNILRGLLKNKTKPTLKGNELKEVNKLRAVQKKLISSVSKIVEPNKQQKVVREYKQSTAKITSTKFLFPSLKIDNAVFSKVNLFGFKSGIQKPPQSSQDFYRTDDKQNDYQTEKISILKRINDNLSNSPNMNLGEVKEEKASGSFFGNIGGLISAALSGGIISSLIAKFFPTLSKIGGITKIGSKLGGLLGKSGGLLKGATKLGGKALPFVGAVFSIYDLVKGVKTGILDYSKYSQVGDKLAAQGAISSMLMNTLGNTINVIGSFLPGPLGIALFALGTSMSLVADKMRDFKGVTSGYIGEAREKTAKTEQLIDVERSKGTMVELRPNFSDYKNIFWEYKSGEEWKPIVDSSTGKYLSAMSGKNPIIQSTDPKLPGIQTYKLNTKLGGQREIVVENGNIYMIVPNVGKVAISTRKSGGPVVKNKTYVVGERQPETYVPNTQQNKKVEKKIASERASLKKQQIQQQREIDNIFQIFFDEMKKIKNFFVDSDSRSSVNDSSENPKMSNMLVGGVNKKTQTPKLSLGLSKTYGQRYASLKDSFANASSKSGVPLETLVKFAHVESGLNTNIGAKTSSAKGLFQFINSTWTAMLKTYGPTYGISLSADRSDPTANAMMGALYIRDNIDALKKRNLTASEQNLYLLHFLGPTGGSKFIQSVLKTPSLDAVTAFPEASKSNMSVFLNKDGSHKTLQDVYDWAGKKMAVDVSYMKSFDIGSWKIKNDQEAFVHQGEMIIPAYHANKIRTAAKSGRMEIAQPQMKEEYDIYSDSNFWINTFMPALANVVKSEFGGE